MHHCILGWRNANNEAKPQFKNQKVRKFAVGDTIVSTLLDHHYTTTQWYNTENQQIVKWLLLF